MSNDLILTTRLLQPGTGISLTRKSDGTIEVNIANINQYAVRPKLQIHKNPYAASLHLVMYYSGTDDLTNAVKVIDTLNNSADRDKIRIYDGNVWSTFPTDGAGTNYNNMPLTVDVRDLSPGYLFYWWHDGTDAVTFQGNASDKYSTAYPVSAQE